MRLCQTLLLSSLLLLATQCKKKDADMARAPALYVSGDASIYSTLKFTSNRAGSSLSWDFGDNTSSVEKEPTHMFIKEGDYLVRLIIDAKDTVTQPLHINLGLQRIARERKWSRKLLSVSGSTDQGDTSFALTMITEEIIALPPHKSVSFFNNSPEVHFQNVKDNIIMYYSMDTASATNNTLIYNAASDVVNITRDYSSSSGSYRLQYTSK